MFYCLRSTRPAVTTSQRSIPPLTAGPNQTVTTSLTPSVPCSGRSTPSAYPNWGAWNDVGAAHVVTAGRLHYSATHNPLR